MSVCLCCTYEIPSLSTMSSSDPLLVLRQAVKSKTPITYFNDGEPTPTLSSATHISLGSTTLAKSTPTRYTKPGVSTDFYTVEAIYLAWLLRDAPGAEYMKQAREMGLAVGFVSVTERKNVVEWLEGKEGDLGRIKPLVDGASGLFCPSCIHLFCIRIDDSTGQSSCRCCYTVGHPQTDCARTRTRNCLSFETTVCRGHTRCKRCQAHQGK